METTKVFSELIKAYADPSIRVIALKGGTRSGKTWAILQALDYIARRSTRPRLISVVSETMPHLKRGAIRDFKNMLETEEVYRPGSWHDTDKIYTYDKARIEFFSADSPEKVLGPARQILYINECINVEWEVYRQLAVRTTEKIILDFNPAHEFWVDSKLMHRPDVRVIHSTYLDNDMLTAAQISEIESNRELDPEWWGIYGEGKTGSKQGLVIKNWDIVPGLPPRSEWKKAYIGIDFGWTAPTAIELVVLSQGEVWIDELAYAPNLDNPDIAKIVIDAGYKGLEIIADPAEPKSKSELKNAGLWVPDGIIKDISLGITVMNRYKKHYTARSVGTIAENRLYRYAKDKKTDEYTNNPIDKHNHAKDCERYVFLNRLSNIAAGFDVTVGTARRSN